jgi:hypothetical protein
VRGSTEPEEGSAVSERPEMTVEVRGCDLFEFRSGKIFHKDSYWKMVEK